MTEKLISNQVLKAPKEAYLISKTNSGVIPNRIANLGTIGRSPSNQITIADPYVSTYHARIERRNDTYIIRDLRSRNGTLVNGTHISEAILKPGDLIQIGDREYVFTHDISSQNNEALPSSKNKSWNEILQSIPSFSQTDLPVLLLGESGTGKEVIANLIHSHSNREKHPFVSVNCSALSESLVESELFGHKKGSFTGATENRNGAFQAARGGTLFLDEIGDLPLDLQPKLLRALENKEIRPVGSDRNIKTDVRIIAATHRNIPLEIERGKFRADLYFRLNVIKVGLPPLRRRMEDFETLLMDFSREMKVRFSTQSIFEMKKYPWIGNIRELKNTVARASAISTNKQIEVDDLPKIMEIDHMKNDHPGALGLTGKPQSSIIKELERKAIVQKLLEMGGNQRRTAEILGIPKSTLHDKIKSFGIDIKGIVESHTISSSDIA